MRFYCSGDNGMPSHDHLSETEIPPGVLSTGSKKINATVLFTPGPGYQNAGDTQTVVLTPEALAIGGGSTLPDYHTPMSATILSNDGPTGTISFGVPGNVGKNGHPISSGFVADERHILVSPLGDGKPTMVARHPIVEGHTSKTEHRFTHDVPTFKTSKDRDDHVKTMTERFKVQSKPLWRGMTAHNIDSGNSLVSSKGSKHVEVRERGDDGTPGTVYKQVNKDYESPATPPEYPIGVIHDSETGEKTFTIGIPDFKNIVHQHAEMLKPIGPLSKGIAVTSTLWDNIHPDAIGQSHAVHLTLHTTPTIVNGKYVIPNNDHIADRVPIIDDEGEASAPPVKFTPDVSAGPIVRTPLTVANVDKEAPEEGG
jgi:hypothetical protein